jgi:sigma-B regulation protein RsbU (phosphoserine phosphatase)
VIAEQLRQAAAELFDRAPCGFVVTTPDGAIQVANSTFLELSGYQRDELLGRAGYELLSAGGRIYFETHVAPMLRMGGTVHELAFELVRRDGARVPVLVNAVLDRDDAGRATQLRMAVFPATHRRDYERELLRAKQRAESSEAQAVALAKTLQSTLIPPSPPAIPRLEVAARYRPAGDGTEVGGDFYDVFQVGPAEWIVVAGDVCGKGVEAAVVTALARHTLRAATMADDRPSAALAELNRALRRHPSDRFCSVVLARLTEADGGWRVQLSTGGHPLPLHRRVDGSVAFAGALGGRILGIVEQVNLTDVELFLAAGESLVMYTDGVPEAWAGNQFYGEHRLARLVQQAASSADELVAAILDDVLTFQVGSARDDIAVLAVRVPEPDDAGATQLPGGV